MADRYGSYTALQLEQLIRIGSRECWRVSRLGIIVKITDAVHDQRYIAESDWVRESLGNPPMVPYEKIDYVRASNLEDGRWQEKGAPCSARSNGSTFLVFRRGSQRHVRCVGGQRTPRITAEYRPVPGALTAAQVALVRHYRQRDEQPEVDSAQ